MNRILQISLFFSFSVFIIISCDNRLPLEDAYLGQEPPGTVPEVFAPGIISSAEYKENGCTFSQDGKEFYFSRIYDSTISILACFYKDGSWSKPEVVLNSTCFDFEPYITKDNNKLFYTRSNHSDSTFKSGIWYANRLKDGWSSPIFFGKGMYVSSNYKGDLFYSGMLSNGWISGQIVKSINNNGEYCNPIELEGDVNSEAYELHPCISHDDDYIIFVSRRTQGRKSDENFNDLYICFRDNDNKWGKAIYLGDILGKSVKMSPYLSPNGNYLFFTCDDNIYWISTSFINELG